MTNSEKINKLDELISRMNTCLSFGSSFNDNLASYGENVKKSVCDVLRDIDVSNISINSILNVSFDSCHRDVFGNSDYNTIETRKTNKCNAYKQSVNSIINILKQERERLIKEQADEEQKKIYDAQIASNKMQKESILWAKIAAFASIISIFVSIILYLCNN